MPEQVETGVRPRGRPRSERARKAILQAASELLLGPGGEAVSIDAVAKRAGVSKATIYRWWRSKETLTLDALYEEWAPSTRVRDTGTLRGDLRALLEPWVRLVGQRPYGAVVARLVAEVQADPAFADEYQERFIGPRRAPGRAVLARAIERGEIPADTDIEVALDLLYGPLYHRLLHRHAPLDEAFADQVVDAVLAGILDGTRE